MSSTNEEAIKPSISADDRIGQLRPDAGEESYIFDTGWTMRREYGLTPNGNPMNGRWVLRDDSGKMIDFDKYRNDLAAHYRLNLDNAK